MERMRHEAEESERIRKELQEKLRLMQEEQERTSRGEKCTGIGAHVLLLVNASNWGCLQAYFPFHGWVLKWYVFSRCLSGVTKEAKVQTKKI